MLVLIILLVQQKMTKIKVSCRIMCNFCKLSLHGCSRELKVIQSLKNTLLESATKLAETLCPKVPL